MYILPAVLYSQVKMALQNKQGPLIETYPGFNPDTVPHSDEITNERRTDRELRKDKLWTADLAMYTLEQHGTLYLARRENNIIFENIEEAVRQLKSTGYYKPQAQDIERVANAESTLRVKISDLDLKYSEKHGDEYGYVEIDTANPDGPQNPEQRKVAERAYGSMDVETDKRGQRYTDFGRNMGVLLDDGMKKTLFWIRNPNYVNRLIKKGEATALPCRLGDFDAFGEMSCFYAGISAVDSIHFFLRGELKTAKEHAAELPDKWAQLPKPERLLLIWEQIVYGGSSEALKAGIIEKEGDLDRYLHLVFEPEKRCLEHLEAFEKRAGLSLEDVPEPVRERLEHISRLREPEKIKRELALYIIRESPQNS